MTRALHTIEHERTKLRNGVAMGRRLAEQYARWPTTVVCNATVFGRASDNSTFSDEELSKTISGLVHDRLGELIEEATRVMAERHRAASEELIVAAAQSAMEGV